MPFTPSHAVVALPFLRTPLPPAAVAVGAMIPDLPLFLRVGPITYAMTHEWLWLPLTVAMALVALLLWRTLLRPAATDLLPEWICRRLPVEWDRSPAEGLRETFRERDASRSSSGAVVLLVVALTIGVLTHLVWDAFTHEGRWGSVLVHALEQDWGPMPGYAWAQRTSSVIGLMVLAGWAIGRLRRAPLRAVRPRVGGWLRWSWWMSLPTLLIIAAASGVIAAPDGEPLTPTAFAYSHLVPAATVWAMVTVTIALVLGVVRAVSPDPRKSPEPGAATRPR